jgi:hypothetical protein
VAPKLKKLTTTPGAWQANFCSSDWTNFSSVLFWSGGFESGCMYGYGRNATGTAAGSCFPCLRADLVPWLELLVSLLVVVAVVVVVATLHAPMLLLLLPFRLVDVACPMVSVVKSKQWDENLPASNYVPWSNGFR